MRNWLRIFFAIFSTNDNFDERKICSLWPLAPLQFYFDFSFWMNQSIPCDSIVKIVYAVGRAHNRVVTSVGMVSFIFVTIWVYKRRVSLIFFRYKQGMDFRQYFGLCYQSHIYNEEFISFSILVGYVYLAAFDLRYHLGIYNKDFIVLITNMVWVFESVYVFNTIWIPKPCKRAFTPRQNHPNITMIKNDNDPNSKLGIQNLETPWHTHHILIFASWFYRFCCPWVGSFIPFLMLMIGTKHSPIYETNSGHDTPYYVFRLKDLVTMSLMAGNQFIPTKWSPDSWLLASFDTSPKTGHSSKKINIWSWRVSPSMTLLLKA